MIVIKKIASRHRKLNYSWYGQFADAEVLEIVAHPFGGQYSPYGDGTSSLSPIIALGEGWAYYMGHFMAYLKYGSKSSQPQVEQSGKFFYNNSTVSSHINVLEGFDPNYTNDPFRWIPLGLYQDLRDDGSETNPITDNVNGFYTNQKMFNAFSSTITTPQAYRTSLLNQNGNNQQTQVTNLFTQYHY